MKAKKWVILIFALASLSFPVWGQEKPVPLSLQEALKLARENHPLLQQAHGDVEAQQGAETQTRSGLLPQINFQSNYTRANSRGGTFGASSAFTVYNTTATLNQLITDFGKTDAKVAASRQSLIQAQENYQQTLQQILFNVVQTYDQVLQNSALVKVQEQSVANFARHLDEAKTAFTVGTQPKIDVTQAEVNLSNGNLSLVQAQNALAISETNLKAAIGKQDFNSLELTDRLSEEDFPITLENALQQAYQNRPDLKAFMAQEESARQSYIAAAKGYNPSISGVTGYGWSGPNFPPQFITWNFGAALNFNVFSGFLTKGQIEQAKGLLDQATAQVNNLKLTINQNVEQTFLNFESAKTQLKVAEDSLRLAKENFELAEGRYKVGVGNYLEFTDAQVNLTQAASSQIQALANYNITLAALKQAMGILQ